MILVITLTLPLSPPWIGVGAQQPPNCCLASSSGLTKWNKHVSKHQKVPPVRLHVVHIALITWILDRNATRTQIYARDAAVRAIEGPRGDRLIGGLGALHRQIRECYRRCPSLDSAQLTLHRSHHEPHCEVFALSQNTSMRRSHSFSTPASSSMTETPTSSETPSPSTSSPPTLISFTASHCPSNLSKVHGRLVTTVRLVGWLMLLAMAEWEI